MKGEPNPSRPKTSPSQNQIVSYRIRGLTKETWNRRGEARKKEEKKNTIRTT